jgi:ATP-dependent Lhr-like helicase
MKRLLSRYAKELGISDIESEGCYYITFKARPEAGEMLNESIRNILMRDGLDTENLVHSGECPIFDKFDEFIPPELLREAFARDRLRADEILERYI